MTKKLLYISILAIIFNACQGKKKGVTSVKRSFDSSTATPVKVPENEVLIVINTSYGTMKARLYNETPKHRDNMVKLIEKGFYDSLLFHRVIKNFVIQGGDPQSKHAPSGAQLGEGDVGYTLPAEFLPQKYFHKKGALAMARENDEVNPKKESSGCQFYIVQGKVQDEDLLEKNEKRINRQITQLITDCLLALSENAALKVSLEKAKSGSKNNDSLAVIQKKIDLLVEPVYKNYSRYRIPDEQRTVYKKIGGTPHLDTHYTVFGEIYEGLEVLDKIANLETDANARPVSDVKMWIQILQKPKK